MFDYFMCNIMYKFNVLVYKLYYMSYLSALLF